MSSRTDMLLEVVDRANAMRSEAKYGEAASLLTDALTGLPASKYGISKALFDELCIPTASLLAARAYCRVKLGKLDGALEDASRAVSFCPQDTSFLLLQAHIHYAMGDVQKAREMCSALVNDAESDIAARALRLQKRCAVDERFSSSAGDGVILDAAGYDDDSQFVETWSPATKNGECPKCGASTASGSPKESADVSCAFLSSAFLKLLHQQQLSNVLCGPSALRIQAHLPAVYALVVQLLHRQEISADIAVELLSHQIGCTFGNNNFDRELLVGASLVFGHTGTSRMFRCSPEASSELCARIVARTHRLQSSKAAQKTFKKFLIAYSSAESFLVDRLFSCTNQSRGIERSASIMEEVFERAQSKALPSVAVAAALLPFCAALFALHAGEIVQSFYSNQSRNCTTSAAPDAENPSVSQEEVVPSATLIEDVQPAAPRRIAGPFMLPIQPSTSIEQFATVLAPIVHQYYLKRSSADAREFARDALHAFAPKEVHGALRSALERMMVGLS